MLRIEEALQVARKEVNFNSSPGIDGIEPKSYRDTRSIPGKAAWTDSEVKRLSRLYEGGYQPSSLRRVQIPKDNGKMRTISIPTIQDRVVSSAINAQISPILKDLLNVYSRGSVKGFGTAYSLKLASQARKERPYCLILDLEKCFDMVNHDILLQEKSQI